MRRRVCSSSGVIKASFDDTSPVGGFDDFFSSEASVCVRTAEFSHAVSYDSLGLNTWEHT